MAGVTVLGAITLNGCACGFGTCASARTGCGWGLCCGGFGRRGGSAVITLPIDLGYYENVISSNQ